MAFRAFVAIPLPRTPATEALLAELAATGAQLKAAEPDQVHLTLSFLGDVADDMAPRMAELLEGATRVAAAFDLPLHGVGAFPNARAPRVVWIGARSCPPLHALAAGVRKALPPDDAKPFRAHVTIGRVREEGRLGSLPAWLAAQKEREMPPVRVDRVVLFKSTLGRGGAVHEPLHEARLEA